MCVCGGGGGGGGGEIQEGGRRGTSKSADLVITRGREPYLHISEILINEILQGKTAKFVSTIIMSELLLCRYIPRPSRYKGGVL